MEPTGHGDEESEQVGATPKRDAVGGRRLDGASRRTLADWSRRACVLGACATLPWWMGLRSVPDMGGEVALAFSLAGLIAMVKATWHKQPLGRGSLNFWDEMLAFNGLCLIIHFVLRVR